MKGMHWTVADAAVLLVPSAVCAIALLHLSVSAAWYLDAFSGAELTAAAGVSAAAMKWIVV